MAIKDRKERERQEMCDRILDAAGLIAAEEGIENLSIRKVAKQIEYSPAIIYHYFRDKEEIMGHLMKRGYAIIVGALSAVPLTGKTPEIRLKELTRAYIQTALQMPEDYLAAQLSPSPAVLEFTSSLFPGASAQKPALGILFQCLKEIYVDPIVDDGVLERTAQIIAVSTFGLIVRLIMEKDIGEEQRALLIDHFVSCLIDGMVMGNRKFID